MYAMMGSVSEGSSSRSKLGLCAALLSAVSTRKGEPYHLVFMLKLFTSLLNQRVYKARGKPHACRVAANGLGGLCHAWK